MDYSFDRYEHTNMVAALVFYSMHVAEPSECIRCLETLAPEPKRPWREIIEDGRAEWRDIQTRCEQNVHHRRHIVA